MSDRKSKGSVRRTSSLADTNILLVLAFLLSIGCGGNSLGTPTTSNDSSSHPKRNTAPPEESPEVTVPLVLDDSGSIAIDATINRTESVRLMLHTGVSSASLTNAAAEKLPGMTWNSQEKISSWGGDAEARVSVKNQLQIGDILLGDVTFTEVERAASGTDGKVGASQLGTRFIEFDFDQTTIRLFNELPDRMHDYQSLPITVRDGLLFVTATLKIGDKQLKHPFMIHTGFGGTILLDDEFVDGNRLNQLLPRLGGRELQDSLGNKILTTQSEIEQFKIGSIELSNVAVELFDVSLGRQKISVVGVDVLRRFNFVIDFDQQRLLIPQVEDNVQVAPDRDAE